MNVYVSGVTKQAEGGECPEVTLTFISISSISVFMVMALASAFDVLVMLFDLLGCRLRTREETFR